jgi:hypothetical protein
MSFNDDDFELNYDELNDESRMTVAEDAMMKVLESIEVTIKKAKDNLEYCERTEFVSNFSVISRYVGAIVEIQKLSDPEYLQMIGMTELTEDEILEKIEEITLSAREMSFTDLKEYEKKKNKVETTKSDPSDTEDNDLGF